MPSRSISQFKESYNHFLEDGFDGQSFNKYINVTA